MDAQQLRRDETDVLPVPTDISVIERTYTPETLVHCHPFAQVVLPDRGRLDLVIDGQRGAVAGTGYAVVAPEMSHVCWADTPTRCLVVDLSATLLSDAALNSIVPPFRSLDARAGTLAHLLRVESAAGGLADPLIAESLGRYAAKAFVTPVESVPSPIPVGPGARLLARRVCAYLDEHFRDDLSLSAVAERAGASVAHVQRSFRAEFGVTIVAYVQDRRLADATELLCSTDLSMTEIATASGFGTPSYFARLFARRYRTTPSGYRAAYWSGSDELPSQL